MKLKPVKLAPALIAVCVIGFTCVLRLINPPFFERPELMTYDVRVRTALHFNPPVATNLGFVVISDKTIEVINDGLLGKPFGLYWPRQIYARLVRELEAQDTKAVGLDIIFDRPRPDHDPVRLPLNRWPGAAEFVASVHGVEPVVYEDESGKMLLMNSDDFFAWQLRDAKNVILATDAGVRPHRLFTTNALAVADISASKDSDGVLRRVKAFQNYTNWHPLFLEVESDPGFGVNLQLARVEGTNIVLPRAEGLDTIHVPIDSDLNFDLRDFVGDERAGKARAFTVERVWHMGIVLAAQELRLDLSKSIVDPGNGTITLHGTNGLKRVLPVDGEGYFHINWEVPYDDPRVAKAPMEQLLIQDMARMAGETNGVTDLWKNKLVVVGSQTVGNDLQDRGATPLEKDTLLVSKHWNVANSILSSRFVKRSSLGLDLLILVGLGAGAGFLTWNLRIMVATGAVCVLIAGYITAAFWSYIQHRYWLPLVLPITGAVILPYIALMVWRVIFEQAEQRRVKGIFSRVVSPDIVHELLQAETLSLGGARREVTVLFADVRGFTEFTDNSQEQAAEFVRRNKLTGPEEEAYYDEQARETLSTVNTYLSLVADMVKKHDGTLDKYIGDCVMAFWGAPTPNTRHALCCVRAAIDSQRAVYELNLRRAEENRRREIENKARASAGLPPRPPLPILLLGSGINTGVATVGLMGSEAHITNYTIFGREVNLASRLETVSGRGRIVISHGTFVHLERDDAVLAATCIPLPDEKVKGIRSAVKIYEVPWRTAEKSSDTTESQAAPGTPAPEPDAEKTA